VLTKNKWNNENMEHEMDRLCSMQHVTKEIHMKFFSGNLEGKKNK
jgi:hypothetical protein